MTRFAKRIYVISEKEREKSKNAAPRLGVDFAEVFLGTACRSANTTNF